MRSPASTREAPTAEALAQGHGAPLPGQQHVSSTQILSALTSSISYNQVRAWQNNRHVLMWSACNNCCVLEFC
jgi:hypothetical protein